MVFVLVASMIVSVLSAVTLCLLPPVAEAIFSGDESVLQLIFGIAPDETCRVIILVDVKMRR